MIQFILTATLIIMIGIIGFILLSDSNIDDDEFE